MSLRAAIKTTLQRTVGLLGYRIIRADWFDEEYGYHRSPAFFTDVNFRDTPPRMGRGNGKHGIEVSAMEEGKTQPKQEASPARRGQPAIEVAPIVDLPYPNVNLGEVFNPVPAILAAPEFAQLTEFFAETPTARRALSALVGQALMYAVIRNLRPDHVVEIGTYKGGVTEVLARAVQTTGATLHTVSPFDAARFQPLYLAWPEALRKHVRYYPLDSMAFFMRLDQQKIRPNLVFIDGNHDLEFVTFDLLAAARRLQPGGFIFVDSVSQAGPFLATMDFLAHQAQWHVCGTRTGSRDPTKAFDRERATIDQTDFIVLRAPFNHFIGQRPMTFGEVDWTGPILKGIRLRIAEPANGTLYTQTILRGFSEAYIEEAIGECATVLDRQMSDVDVTLPLMVKDGYNRYQLETWFVWIGNGPLPLREIPQPF